MDFNPIVSGIGGVFSLVVIPIAGLLVNKAINVAQSKFGLQVSQADVAAVDSAVSAGVGMLRAKLVTGQMALPDVIFGNKHVDEVSQIALDIAGAAANATNITKAEIAGRIVGAVGHALGEDPSVPSVATNAAQGPVKVALLAILLGGAVLGLSACTPPEQAAAVQGATAGVPCLLAIQAKIASEPSATDEQKALDAGTVAITNTSCLALGTDAATLVQQATATATTATAP